LSAPFDEPTVSQQSPDEPTVSQQSPPSRSSAAAGRDTDAHLLQHFSGRDDTRRRLQFLASIEHLGQFAAVQRSLLVGLEQWPTNFTISPILAASVKGQN
jgi:hypothetical protein